MPAMIVFRCPHCDFKIEVEEKYAGKTGTCQNCRGAITVPLVEAPAPTGLDALRDMPDATPVEYGAYGKAADAAWEDPAAKAAAVPVAEAPKVEPVVLPDIPAEVLAAVKARRRQTMQYIFAAVLVTLIALVVLLPLFAPKPKAEQKPAPMTPAPKFGEEAAQ